jgi:hypothetical protein
MKFRTLGLVTGLAALCAAPFPAQASGSDKAADACIQAFVQSYLPKNRQVQVRTLTSNPGPLGAYTKRYTIDLTAKTSRSGTELVTARCVANANGKVLTLDSPIDGYPVADARASRQQ